MPSVSVAAKPVASVVGPALIGTLALVTFNALGGLLPIGIVKVAGVASVTPLLSVAVNVNVLLPVNVPLGSNLKLEACARVSTCPTVTAVVPSARYRMPWATGGSVDTVNEAIVPSLSVAARLEMVVAPAVLGMLGLVISVATGGVFVTTTVYVAGVKSTNPVLSVAVKVKVALPLNVPDGSKRNPAACAGVRTWPAVTAVTPSAKYRMPCATGGRVDTVYVAIVPSASVAARLEIVVGPALEGMLLKVTLVAVGRILGVLV